MILIHTLLSDVSVFLELVVASALALHRRQSLAPDRATAGPPSGVSGGGGGAAGSGMATLVARSDTSARGTPYHACAAPPSATGRTSRLRVQAGLAGHKLTLFDLLSHSRWNSHSAH
jgi:hypothetical protein